MTSSEYAMYEAEINARRVDNGVHLAMINDAKKEGLAEGKADGLAEGEAKGLAKGVLEGKREMMRALKANGMTIADIARLSGLSRDEVADALKEN
jgi:predicted transposase/invertase (TIGR01784 family)